MESPCPTEEILVESERFGRESRKNRGRGVGKRREEVQGFREESGSLVTGPGRIQDIYRGSEEG